MGIDEEFLKDMVDLCVDRGIVISIPEWNDETGNCPGLVIGTLEWAEEVEAALCDGTGKTMCFMKPPKKQ